MRTRSLLKQNEDLRNSLRMASQENVLIHERVLQKLGADLHDGPAQLLTFALLQADRLLPIIERLEDPKTLSTASSLRSVIADTHKEIRSVSTDLSLPELEGATLLEAIELSIQRHEQLAGVKVTLVDRLEIRVDDMSALSFFAYRFVQECLSNIRKHSGATMAKVDAYTGNRIRISVSDNGHGFNVANVPRTSLGLTGMRSRIRALGGEMEVSSSPTSGTRVTAILDLTAGAIS